MKPTTFHEFFYKSGTDPEGLTLVTPIVVQNIAIAEPNVQQQFRGTFASHWNNNYWGFRGGRMLQNVPMSRRIDQQNINHTWNQFKNYGTAQ